MAPEDIFLRQLPKKMWMKTFSGTRECDNCSSDAIVWASYEDAGWHLVFHCYQRPIRDMKCLTEHPYQKGVDFGTQGLSTLCGGSDHSLGPAVLVSYKVENFSYVLKQGQEGLGVQVPICCALINQTSRYWWILIFLGRAMSLISLTTTVNSIGAMDRPKGRARK